MSSDPMAADGLDIGIVSMVRDEPGYRIQFRVEEAPAGQLEMRLEMADSLTYWKSASYFMLIPPWNMPVEYRRIETKNRTKTAQAILLASEIIQFGRFDLWKGGVLAFGAFASSVSVNTWANRGRRLVFRWEED